MKVAIYTTIFGRYDTLKEIPEQTHPVNYYCVCDKIPLGENQDIIHDWIFLKKPNIQKFNSRMNAKLFKYRPDLLPELKKYDIVIFIDAKIKIISNRFVEYCMTQIDGNDWSMPLHPQRENIFAEAIASERLKKYSGQEILKQAEKYREEGFYTQVNLFEAAIMVRRMNRGFIFNEIGMGIYRECVRYSHQDQVSLPYVCWKHSFSPVPFKQDESYNNYSDNEYWKVQWIDKV